MAPVEAVIFDLDGVIRHWPAASVAEIELDLGLPAGAIEAAAFSSPLLPAMLVGRVDRRAWLADAARLVGVRHGPPAVDAVRRWAGLRPTIDPAAVALVLDVGRRHPVALLSNADRNVRSDLAAAGLDLERLFEVAVFSAEIGVAKPDPDVFLHTAELLDAAPQSCLVVDDVASNVAGARAAGMAAICHRSVVLTRRAIREHGIEIEPETDESGLSVAPRRQGRDETATDPRRP